MQTLNGPQQIKIDISQLEDVKCKRCGGTLFVPVFLIKRISPLLSPTGREEFITIPASLACLRCGEVLHVDPNSQEGSGQTVDTSSTVGKAD